MKVIRNDPKLKERRRELRKNWTETEKLFWSKIKKRQFFGLKFMRQYSIGPYILDFYCPKMSLAVELDGGQHNQEEIRIYDNERTAYLASIGIRELRFWNNEVFKNIEGVLEKIREKITPPHLPLLQEEVKGRKNKIPPLEVRGGQGAL